MIEYLLFIPLGYMIHQYIWKDEDGEKDVPNRRYPGEKKNEL